MTEIREILTEIREILTRGFVQEREFDDPFWSMINLRHLPLKFEYNTTDSLKKQNLMIFSKIIDDNLKR